MTAQCLFLRNIIFLLGGRNPDYNQVLRQFAEEFDDCVSNEIDLKLDQLEELTRKMKVKDDQSNFFLKGFYKFEKDKSGQTGKKTEAYAPFFFYDRLAKELESAKAREKRKKHVTSSDIALLRKLRSIYENVICAQKAISVRRLHDMLERDQYDSKHKEIIEFMLSRFSADIDFSERVVNQSGRKMSDLISFDFFQNRYVFTNNPERGSDVAKILRRLSSKNTRPGAEKSADVIDLFRMLADESHMMAVPQLPQDFSATENAIDHSGVDFSDMVEDDAMYENDAFISHHIMGFLLWLSVLPDGDNSDIADYIFSLVDVFRNDVEEMLTSGAYSQDMLEAISPNLFCWSSDNRLRKKLLAEILMEQRIQEKMKLALAY